jgi:hypothetical protein
MHRATPNETKLSLETSLNLFKSPRPDTRSVRDFRL